MYYGPREGEAHVGETHDSDDAHLQLRRPRHLHPPEHHERDDQQQAVGQYVPGIEADYHVDERQACGLRAVHGDGADVCEDGRVAEEYGDEEGGEGADDEAGDEGAVEDHPGARGEGCEAHVEEEDGDFDGGDGDVEEGEGGDGYLWM